MIATILGIIIGYHVLMMALALACKIIGFFFELFEEMTTPKGE